jgi:TolA-binding protein
VSTAPEEIPTAEIRFVEASEFYIKEYPKGDRLVDVKFRIAAIYYRRHHFDEALTRFQEIATDHPKHRAATTAANIVLDIYNIKKDYDKLADAASTFASTSGLGDASFRADMNQILSEIGFKRIEKLEAENKWDEAGDAYMKVYKASPAGPLAERALYNAYISYDKGGNAAHSAEASRLFIAKFPKSQYTERLTIGLAKAAESAYDFAVAQRLYVDFYHKYPKARDARKALYNAAVFAEVLEMNKEALALYTEYLRDRSIVEKEKRAIQVSLAKLYRKTGDLEKMTLTFRRLARDAGSHDEKMGYLGELARQLEQLGKTTDKEGLVKEMRWLHNAAPGEKLTGLGAYYVAEAEFRALADKRKRYDEIKLRFPPEDLVYLLRRKRSSSPAWERRMTRSSRWAYPSGASRPFTRRATRTTTS